MIEATSFGNWIRQRRRALDLTQDELAARVGCSLSAIRKIEADERRPSRQIAELLAQTLEISQTDQERFLKIARMELGSERLPAASLPVAMAPAHGGNGAHPVVAARPLPTPATPLVGREVEVAHISEILLSQDCRLLTLAGPGGIGKTRLAIAVAHNLSPAFAGGVGFVPLAVVNTPESIVAAIAAALGLRVQGAADAKMQLINYLAPRQLLLVLDNFEHLLDGAELLAEILAYSQEIRLMITSRERLGLAGEWVLDIHGLGVPAQGPLTSQELPSGWDRASAVVLFLQAARRANPAFRLHTDDYPAMAEICRLVEGIPLGIELAAAWVRMLTCGEIADEMKRSLDFLATTARDVPQRQRSLRAAFEYSWNLLAADERTVLRRLSVFSNGFTRAAAEAGAGATLLTLSALMAKSLVMRHEDGRYDLHQIVRQYAAEKLAEAGETEAVHTHHWMHYLALAQETEAARSSQQYMALVERLEIEYDNFQTALEYLLAHQVAQAWQLASAMTPLWYRRPVREVERWMARLFERARQGQAPLDPGHQARVLLTRATFKGSVADLPGQIEEVLALARAAQNDVLIATALAMLALDRIIVGQGDQGSRYMREAQQIARELNDPATLANVLAIEGEAARYEGRYAQAAQLYTASLDLAQQIGRTDLLADSLSSLTMLALRQGLPQKAEQLVEEVLALYESVHDRISWSAAQLIFARTLTLKGDYAGAEARLATAEAVYHEDGYTGADYFIAALRGDLAYARGEIEPAYRAYRRAIDLGMQRRDPVIAALALRGLACCSLRLNALVEAEAAIDEGRRMSEPSNEKWMSALMEYVSGQLAWVQGNAAGAEQHLRAGLQQVLRLGDNHAIAQGLERLGFVYSHTARAYTATQLFGAAAALRNQIGAPVPPVDREALAQGIALAHASLPDADYARAWAEGTASVVDDVERAGQLALSTPPVHQ